jgi:hypothetical protein
MAEVKRMCNEIKANLSSLYAVFLSTGHIPGVDPKVCLSFWSMPRQDSSQIQLSDWMQKQEIELFVIHVLPFLNASTNHPQMVNLGRAGIETANLTPRRSWPSQTRTLVNQQRRGQGS